MNEVYLLLGSNIGNRLLYLSKAVVEIDRRIGEIIRRSSLYETEPWGFTDDLAFINMVIAIQTTLSPERILERIHAIETSLGRERAGQVGYQSRTIDIDILFFGEETIDKPDLIIPHPRLHERRFTLEPMSEIAPEFPHPVFHKSISTLLKKCNDNHTVNKIVR